jgi:alkylation response protein AidB-like acyl-CoA dehydrogenase
LDFNLSKSQKMFVKGLRDVLTKEFTKEYFRKLDDEKKWPYEAMKKLGELGYLGLSVPEEYGGYGGDALDVTLCIEEAARSMGGPAMAYFTTVCFGSRAISLFGTEKQKKQILPGLLEGTSYVALGLTEPDGGTDILGAMKTSAAPDGNGNYIINGAKIFTTGGHIADWIIVVVRTSGFEEKKAKGVTMFLVPSPSEGLVIEPIPIFCHGATGANHLYFDNVVVPEENIFGELDKGLYSLFSVLNDERIGAAAMALGLAQAAFEEALEYAKIRHAFGRPIGQFQAIQHKLAECWSRLQSIRYLVYNAAWKEANKIPAEMESSAAKLIASENALWIINECMEVLGGYQVTKDFNMHYYFRDCRFTFAPITNNAVKNYIGESLGLPKSY